MKTTKKVQQIVMLLGGLCFWAFIFGQLGPLTPEAAAEEPTAMPTPTAAPTWTPVPDATATTPPNVPVAPTPESTATPIPSNRLVDFRTDSDEIDEGECVLISWVVRGDIDRIEFDQDDDNKDPVLVSDMDSREECPTVDSKYRLHVRWLNGEETRRDVEVEVHSVDGNGDGSSGGSSSTSSGSTAPGSPGAFIPVTPILITTPEPSDPALPAANGQSAGSREAFLDTSGQAAPPSGPLASVRTLPETGARSGDASEQRATPAGAFYAGLIILLSGVAGLVLLVGWTSRSKKTGLS